MHAGRYGVDLAVSLLFLHGRKRFVENDPDSKRIGA